MESLLKEKDKSISEQMGTLWMIPNLKEVSRWPLDQALIEVKCQLAAEPLTLKGWSELEKELWMDLVSISTKGESKLKLRNISITNSKEEMQDCLMMQMKMTFGTKTLKV